MDDSTQSSASTFFTKYEFAIRRFHSLTGIFPLGLYMVVHLTTNASLMNGAETFQSAVFMIHAPGNLLPLIEWGLIFAPLLFHAILGVWIAKTGANNTSKYTYTSNRRYYFQRITGIVALVFLFFHILHLHGWFHFGIWIDSVRALGFGKFYPYNAASSLAGAMQSWVWPVFYLVGVLSCVYHLANGLWTSGITWGLWVTPAAQQRATKACVAFGAILTVISLSAWWAAVAPNDEDIAEMRQVEDRMYEAALELGKVPEMAEKRAPSVTDDATVSSDSEMSEQEDEIGKKSTDESDDPSMSLNSADGKDL